MAHIRDTRHPLPGDVTEDMVRGLPWHDLLDLAQMMASHPQSPVAGLNAILEASRTLDVPGGASS